MKYFIIILIGLTVLSCSSKKYVLADQSSENQKLVKLIDKLKKEKKINKNPVIVINEKVIKKSELKNLKIYNSDIIGISVINKDNSKMTQIYGEKSIGGVILIETKQFQEKAIRTIAESKVLFLIDGKEITQEEMEKIDPNDIKTVTIIKGKKEIIKYTTEKYDGVVIIEMKKK
tara:strand:- start:1044 stop:1565 length:522 start_codon:yes stop_codon:yes gene_type:complete